ncbi:MAG TPA: hypothetical protein VGB30_07805 [bacterium]|jgi:hypothetical protein
MWTTKLRFLIIILLINIYPRANCSGSERGLEQQENTNNYHPFEDTLSTEDLKLLGKDLLYLILDNWDKSFDLENQVSRYPDIYDLYAAKIRPGSLFSKNYWVDIGRYSDLHGSSTVDTRSYTYEYIFLLPNDDNESIYLITNYFNALRENGNIFQLLRCRSDDAPALHEGLESNSLKQTFKHEILCEYNILYSDDNSLTIQTDHNP